MSIAQVAGLLVGSVISGLMVAYAAPVAQKLGGIWAKRSDG